MQPIAPPVTTPPGRLKLAPQWLLFAGLALAIPLAPLLLTRAAPRLPELGELPAFALTDQLGRPFGRDDLRGKVWVADFVFTSCSDACPRLTQRMKSLQDRLQRVRGRRHARRLPEQVEDILQRMDALPTLDERPEDEILGYDKNGAPTGNRPEGGAGGH